MSNARHVLGISGGKDSAALAIYLHQKYPQLNVDYYFCDTGEELKETTDLVNRLEGYLGKKIELLKNKDAAQNPDDSPFNHFIKIYRGYIPSPVARWCTKKLKLEPFEEYVGTVPTISYVGIRGDENREGYISKKTNIQSIFPFRKNIWSEDVIKKLLHPSNATQVAEFYSSVLKGKKLDKATGILLEDLPQEQKLDELLNIGIVDFNHVTFSFLKTTEYPLAKEEDFPLIYNDEILVREDIFRLLRESGVGVPEYYEKKPFEINGQKGDYARSRSGCYFCFYQQKIEWIWLYEQHPDKFKQAMEYEDPSKGFTWNQHESLTDLINPLRMAQIKKDHLRRQNKEKSSSSPYLIDILDDTESEGCTACFI